MCAMVVVVVVALTVQMDTAFSRLEDKKFRVRSMMAYYLSFIEANNYVLYVC
jgi:hypothetical protein